jgi:hypothetical protein
MLLAIGMTLRQIGQGRWSCELAINLNIFYFRMVQKWDWTSSNAMNVLFLSWRLQVLTPARLKLSTYQKLIGA